jgi:hypothetical protein
MTRLRGWAPRGQRLVDKVPQGKWKTATFLAALRNDRIDAPCLFDGPINGDVWSRPLMGHSYRVIRRMRYGPGSSWERLNDRGGASSDTT